MFWLGALGVLGGAVHLTILKLTNTISTRSQPPVYKLSTARADVRTLTD
jgi:hypothetical protein